MDQLTPDTLAAYVRALRDSGAASARVVLDGVMDLSVVFSPDAMPMPKGDELTPGAWKGPGRLDRDPLDDERSVP